MFFKDVITEMTENLMSRNRRKCPVCKKAILKKNEVIEHYIQVVSLKFIGALIGGSVPAPDYYFKCPKCKSMFLLIEGKWVAIKKGNK